MIMFLIVAFIITTMTFYKKHAEFDVVPSSLPNILEGKLASSFEKTYEDNLLIKDAAVGLWGTISYGVLNTGHKKVVVGDDEWLFTEEEFMIHPDGRDEENKKIEIIQSVNRFLNENDIELIIAIIPSKSRIYSDLLSDNAVPKIHENLYNRFRLSLINRGISALDLLQPFMHGKDKGRQIFLRLDTHWTPEGAEIAANIIADNTRHIDRDKTAFITTKTPNTPYEGDLEKYVPTGIFKGWLGIKPETYIARDTIADDNGDGYDLFGDQIIPITLVGTSYSAINKWNFANALKQSLNADVLNVALEGKGPMQPMADYLASNDFKNSDTKMVIWEIPERFIQKTYDDVIFPDKVMNIGGGQ